MFNRVKPVSSIKESFISQFKEAQVKQNAIAKETANKISKLTVKRDAARKEADEATSAIEAIKGMFTIKQPKVTEETEVTDYV